MEQQPILVALATMIIFGTGAQWLAWRLRLPSILLLLACGFVAGPVLHIVRPDEMFGELLFPFVSLCVAVILFEGSLSLHFSELREIGSVLLWLFTVGAMVTWGLGILGAHYIIGMGWMPSTLLAAILVVTGPTVIGPILRQIRPTGPVGPIARWEGIVIDPIGAILAVLVFEAYRSTVEAGVNQGSWVAVEGLLLTVISGVVAGAASAFLLVRLLRQHALPDHLESLVALMFVVFAFTVSNLLQKESGLIAVTLMGILVANSGVSLKQIVEFKESLSLLLISGLFILLAARVKPEAFLDLGWRGVAFVAFMILVVRPLSILASTWSSKLTWKEKVFLAWLAPRGIVAASVASVFAIELGPEDGAGLVPATFALIVGTVVTYGLTAYPLALKLGLASKEPQGLLLVGAHPFASGIGQAVQQAGFPVLLVDTNHRNIRSARMEGLRTTDMNILQEDAAERLDLGGIGRMLAMTPNDEVNSLAAMNMAELFGRANIFQLTPWRQVERNEQPPPHLRSRYLFSQGLTFDRLLQRYEEGDQIKTTKLTKEFDFLKFQEMHQGQAIPLFHIVGNRLTVIDAETRQDFKPGEAVIALVPKIDRTAVS
ncbi:cation:proton antiporter [Planctomicrobium piriforme]|uniref:NhaP-type Na+/H+ or K+/H+ antiporter n=1 Tax=Planctomicrobium piriforme TaxID=1576369 RepID=A0A1I3BD65_9PLAN|nr:sodium:proton antiporter [Planctomicrobium piriforme]SFH60036.1 NhaP-type Na+/H+ or K+/H+ antiporter [Planctomicrobium piriforme]